MNTQIFTCDSRFSKLLKTLALVTPAIGVALVCQSASAEWKVDFSRRAKAARDHELHAAGQPSPVAPAQSGGRQPASATMAPDAYVPAVQMAEEATPKQKGLLDSIFETGDPVQDVVILNTDKGFVPSTVRVRKNGRYRVHVVNVNDKEKNVSFILDGFSEHHATFYGKIKTFILEPKKEGAFSFQSPETSSEGKMIVFNPEIVVRDPASEGSR